MDEVKRYLMILVTFKDDYSQTRLCVEEEFQEYKIKPVLIGKTQIIRFIDPAPYSKHELGFAHIIIPLE